MRKILVLLFLSLLTMTLPTWYSQKIMSITRWMPYARSQEQPHTLRNASWEHQVQQTTQELHDALDYSARATHEQFPSIVAQVILCPHTSWSSVLWINKGSCSPDLPFTLKRNDPVLVGSSLIGLVDFVGAHVCKVRLISDPSMHIPVRVIRGGYEKRLVAFMAQELYRYVETTQELFREQAAKKQALSLMKYLSMSTGSTVERCCATGELRGSPTREGLLQGIGYPIHEHSTKEPSPTPSSHEEPHLSLLQPGDLLETSGIDTVLPAGLCVARICQVLPLAEGSLGYSFTARATAPSLAAHDYVTIVQGVCPEVDHTEGSLDA